MAPLQELKRLESEIDNASSLDALKPIFERLDEIARVFVHDFEVQLVVADLREHLVHRGIALRRLAPEANRIPSPEKKPINIRRTLAIGAGLGVIGWLVLFVTLVQIARNRNIDPRPVVPVTAPTTPATAGSVPVDIVTTPPGASIQINNDTKCTSNCRLNLVPGNYQVTAMLDGYDPAATGVTVLPGGSPINVTLALLNQAQTVRIFTDLPSGRVILDGNPAQDLQDGQLVLDRVKNGKHKLTLIGPNNDANFTFNLVAGKAPTIESPIVANNLLAVLVGSFGANAHVQSNSVPVKVSLNGQPRGEIGSAGLDLQNVPTGDQQLAIGEGQDQRKMVVTFGPMPALTAFLKSDINSGTLVVSTGEDDVTVYLNGREYRRKTRRGQLRIPLLGSVRVGVAKPGFQPPSDQTAELKKGEESRLAFTLKPLPQVASLQIRGAGPGTTVTIDEHPVGRVGADGTLSAANLSPGERVIELRRDGYVHKRMTRTLRAGETLVLGAGEVAMAVASGTIHLVLTPGDAQVTYRRSDEQQAHAAHETTLRLDAGIYLFTAKASGFLERTERIPVVAGETRNVELGLAKEVEQPKPRVAGVVVGSNDWAGWVNESGVYVRKGGNRVAVHSGPLNGIITFTAHIRKGGGLFRGPKLRWFIDDGAQISQFEIDKKRLSAKDEADDGNEKVDRKEIEEKKYTIQIEITPDHIIQRARIGARWITLDSEAGRSIANGKFGFVIPGGDEIAVSDFRYAPK